MAIADFVVKHGATVNEIATFTSQTDATSTSTAAVTVAGGVGIALKLIVGSTISGTQLISTVATGTAPFTVNSSTVVANLTAATVATNANLTGPITSTGNTTAVASQTGTGSKFVMDTSPTLVTPALGVATATSINGLTITSSTGTLTVANGKIFTVNNTVTLAGTDSTTITLPATTGTVALNNQIHFIGTTSIAINRASLAQTLSGVSIDGNASTVTTNANLTGPITSTGNTTAVAIQTGTGSKFVMDTSPTLVTPALGVATATSINKVAISTIGTTANASIVLGDTKTLTVNNTLTFNGTDASSVAFGTGGTVVYASGGLSQFTAASTTSAQLATVISDETGSGKVVFDTSPAFTTSITTGSTSFDLINTTATTVNFAKAATALSIGATTGTTTINNDVVISGALTVNGTVTTVNSTTMTVDDKNLELGSITTPTDVSADGGGITLRAAANKTFQWASASNTWVSNIGLTAASSIISSSTSFDLINTTATTINFAGAATTLAIGVSGTTTTLTGAVKLPTVGTSGLVKLGVGGALSADNTTYVVSGGALGTPTSGTLTNCTSLPVASISATGTKDSTTYLAGDGTWKSTLLEPTYTPPITGSGAITLTIDFATVNSTTILIPLSAGITGATITFTNLSSKAISNTVFSFNVVLSHVSALSATTSIVWKFGAALNPKWTGNIIPPSTVAASAIDIWSFFTYDAGSSLVGSLSMADVRNA